ncbi:MAG: beta-ketoacyl-ACP synthase II [Anaerolineae bacterium]|nr:beta-ketoacyl-ACP synthase II [Anaerolineae bacterium]MDW8071662.1 beta-ketoacyl-ACP synthase II [Anaerolineae bacterium]
MANILSWNGRRRVVITGMGAVTPLGLDVASTWQALIEGKSGVTRITHWDVSQYPTQMAAFVKGFDATRYVNPRDARRLSPFILYGLAAAKQAIAQAKLDFSQEDMTRIGVEIGSSMGGSSIVEEQRLILDTKGVRQINPTLIPAILINTVACAVAIALGIKGPVNSVSGACATGLISLGEAVRKLSWGDADVMIAGGSEAVLSPLSVAGFARLGATSVKNDQPERACAPFDLNRDGTVVGEGAAVVVLETLDHAQRRGAAILAEVLGYSLTCDAYHLVAPDPSGEGAARAMQAALQEANVSPAELDWIVAHGTATKMNDAIETKAIKMALGEETAYRVPVSSNKGALGHMIGAAGAISVVAAVQAMLTNIIAPTINYETPDPECDLDYVPNVGRPATVKTVMVNCFGFGGQNSCLVLRKWEG